MSLKIFGFEFKNFSTYKQELELRKSLNDLSIKQKTNEITVKSDKRKDEMINIFNRYLILRSTQTDIQFIITSDINRRTIFKINSEKIGLIWAIIQSPLGDRYCSVRNEFRSLSHYGWSGQCPRLGLIGRCHSSTPHKYY